MRAAVHSQLMQLQVLQIAVQTNFWMQLPYTRALAEIEGAELHGFMVPNSILNLQFTQSPKDYFELKDKVRKLFVETTASCFIDILIPKHNGKAFIQNAYDRFFSKLPIATNIESKARSLKSYSIYLAHQYCDRVLAHFYNVSLCACLFPVSQSLRELCRLFPENELLFDCEQCHGLELAPFTLRLSLQLEKAEDRGFDVEGTLLKIPSSETAAKMLKKLLRESIGRSDMSYELDETKPESLVKEYLKFDIKKAGGKNYFRSKENAGLYAYDVEICKKLSGLVLIRNIITLELAIESTHVAGKFWLQVINNLQMNCMLWHSTNANTILANSSENVEDQIERIREAKKKKQKKLISVEFMLRSISNRIKVIDFSLYKASEYKVDAVLEYLYAYYRVPCL